MVDIFIRRKRHADFALENFVVQVVGDVAYCRGGVSIVVTVRAPFNFGKVDDGMVVVGHIFHQTKRALIDVVAPVDGTIPFPQVIRARSSLSIFSKESFLQSLRRWKKRPRWIDIVKLRCGAIHGVLLWIDSYDLCCTCTLTIFVTLLIVCVADERQEVG
jgi:hypothetical protein